MRLCLLLLCLLTACTVEPKEWTRPDGLQINPAQLQLDKTACEGEVAKAKMTNTDNKIGLGPTVYEGCMATRGYLAAKGN